MALRKWQFISRPVFFFLTLAIIDLLGLIRFALWGNQACLT